MSETNGQFVHRILDSIDAHIERRERSLVDKLLMKIRRRSKEVYMDPMWFIIALRERHKGHAWSSMEKYGVRSNEQSISVGVEDDE